MTLLHLKHTDERPVYHRIEGATRYLASRGDLATVVYFLPCGCISLGQKKGEFRPECVVERGLDALERRTMRHFYGTQKRVVDEMMRQACGRPQ